MGEQIPNADEQQIQHEAAANMHNAAELLSQQGGIEAHSGGRSPEDCPFLNSLGAAGIELMQQYAAAEKAHPSPALSIEERLAAKRARQKQVAEAQPEPLAEIDAIAVKHHEVLHQPEIAQVVKTPIEAILGVRQLIAENTTQDRPQDGKDENLATLAVYEPTALGIYQPPEAVVRTAVFEEITDPIQPAVPIIALPTPAPLRNDSAETQMQIASPPVVGLERPIINVTPTEVALFVQEELQEAPAEQITETSWFPDVIEEYNPPLEVLSTELLEAEDVTAMTTLYVRPTELISDVPVEQEQASYDDNEVQQLNEVALETLSDDVVDFIEAAMEAPLEHFISHIEQPMQTPEQIQELCQAVWFEMEAALEAAMPPALRNAHTAALLESVTAEFQARVFDFAQVARLGRAGTHEHKHDLKQSILQLMAVTAGRISRLRQLMTYIVHVLPQPQLVR